MRTLSILIPLVAVDSVIVSVLSPEALVKSNKPVIVSLLSVKIIVPSVTAVLNSAFVPVMPTIDVWSAVAPSSTFKMVRACAAVSFSTSPVEAVIRPSM